MIGRTIHRYIVDMLRTEFPAELIPDASAARPTLHVTLDDADVAHRHADPVEDHLAEETLI